MHDSLWRAFLDALHAEFPEASIILVRRQYHPWSRTHMEAYRDEIVRAHGAGEEVLLIGHSMGGLIALAAAARMHNVQAVVTLFSPHQLFGGYFTRKICEKSVPVSIISFGAIPDRMVPYGARHPDASFHRTFLTDHLWGLKWKGAEIARLIRLHLKP